MGALRLPPRLPDAARHSNWKWGRAPVPRGLLALTLSSEGLPLCTADCAWLPSLAALTRLAAAGSCAVVKGGLMCHVSSLRGLRALDVRTEQLPSMVGPSLVRCPPKLSSLRLAGRWSPHGGGSAGLPPASLSPGFGCWRQLASLDLAAGLLVDLEAIVVAAPEPALRVDREGQLWLVAAPVPPGGPAPRLGALTSLALHADDGDDEGRQPPDERLARVLREAPALRRLEVRGQPPSLSVPLPRFTGAGLEPLAPPHWGAGGSEPALRRLGALAVTRCPTFGGAGLRVAGRLGRSLLNLDLSDCSGVDDGGFAHLRGLSQLTRAPRPGGRAAGRVHPRLPPPCVQLAMQTHPPSPSWHPRLRPPAAGLDVSGCERLSDASLSLAALHMPRLASLAAAGVTRLTDRGLAPLARLRGALLALALGPAPRVTDAGVASLAALGCLTRLELRGCTRITAEGLAAMAGGGAEAGAGPVGSGGSSDDEGGPAAAAPRPRGLRCLSCLDLSGCGLGMEDVMALSPLTRVAQIVY